MHIHTLQFKPPHRVHGFTVHSSSVIILQLPRIHAVSLPNPRRFHADSTVSTPLIVDGRGLSLTASTLQPSNQLQPTPTNSNQLQPTPTNSNQLQQLQQLQPTPTAPFNVHVFPCNPPPEDRVWKELLLLAQTYQQTNHIITSHTPPFPHPSSCAVQAESEFPTLHTLLLLSKLAAHSCQTPHSVGNTILDSRLSLLVFCRRRLFVSNNSLTTLFQFSSPCRKWWSRWKRSRP